MTAEVIESGIILGERIYIVSKDFQKAKENAIRIFEDNLISKAKGLPTFENKLMEIKEITVTEYVRKKKMERDRKGRILLV